MADPFSILAGAAGLADVCIRLGKFLKDANHGFRVVDQELDELLKEITSLQSVNASIEELLKRSYPGRSTAQASPNLQQVLDTNWQATNATLSSCKLVVEKIEAILKDVVNVGSGRHVKRDQIRKWIKQQSRGDELNTLRGKLKQYQLALQLSLSAVAMSGPSSLIFGINWLIDLSIDSRTSQQASHNAHSDLSTSIQNLGAGLKLKIESLESIVSQSADQTVS